MRYRTQQAPCEYTSPAVQYLEHGNYKLFGFSKRKAGVTNKFLMSTAKEQQSARTAANSTLFVDSTCCPGGHINTKHYHLNNTMQSPGNNSILMEQLGLGGKGHQRNNTTVNSRMW